ncbi:MAG: hypothetical protein MZV64_34970 [Ignavibacteriales bacterium]|nr:hypothetical protein [Ignavibacteriales bacterium]
MAEASRAALGGYLGTHADNLVYTQNVTISLNIVARSLDLGPGDEVLATDHEYGAHGPHLALPRQRARLPLHQPARRTAAHNRGEVHRGFLAGRHAAHARYLPQSHHLADRHHFPGQGDHPARARGGHPHGH